MKQGRQVFVASLINFSEKPTELASILVVFEFLDIIPKILPSIPPPREIEFIIYI